MLNRSVGQYSKKYSGRRLFVAASFSRSQDANHMKFRIQQVWLLSLSVLLQPAIAFALSPPHPSEDIPWDAGTAAQGSVESVEMAFSHARRVEEAQHKLVANALGDLELPEQAEWDGMSAAEMALMISNSERSARHNVHYPSHGMVLGLPFEGADSHLNKIAQDYADYMVSQDYWAHNPPAYVTATPFAGSDSFNRISNHEVIGGECYQFLAVAENLYVTASSVANAPVPKTIIERAIYGWLYEDANSAWGHRVAMFLQDQTLAGDAGFNNDRGETTSEGLMGIGVAGRGDGTYTVFDAARFPSQWNVVWLVMDPAPSNKCNFDTKNEQ